MSCSFMFVILVVAVIVALVVRSSANDRRRGPGHGAIGCPHCGSGHPAFAQFCRRCGRRLR